MKDGYRRGGLHWLSWSDGFGGQHYPRDGYCIDKVVGFSRLAKG